MKKWKVRSNTMLLGGKKRRLLILACVLTLILLAAMTSWVLLYRKNFMTPNGGTQEVDPNLQSSFRITTPEEDRNTVIAEQNKIINSSATNEEKAAAYLIKAGLLQLHNDGAAAEAFKKAQLLTPNDPTASISLCTLYFNKKDKQATKQHCQAALDILNKNPGSLFEGNRGMVVAMLAGANDGKFSESEAVKGVQP